MLFVGKERCHPMRGSVPSIAVQRVGRWRTANVTRRCERRSIQSHRSQRKPALRKRKPSRTSGNAKQTRTSQGKSTQVRRADQCEDRARKARVAFADQLRKQQPEGGGLSLALPARSPAETPKIVPGRTRKAVSVIGASIRLKFPTTSGFQDSPVPIGLCGSARRDSRFLRRRPMFRASTFS